jgi:hypothetical protein
MEAAAQTVNNSQCHVLAAVIIEAVYSLDSIFLSDRQTTAGKLKHGASLWKTLLK